MKYGSGRCGDIGYGQIAETDHVFRPVSRTDNKHADDALEHVGNIAERIKQFYAKPGIVHHDKSIRHADGPGIHAVEKHCYEYLAS